MERAANGFRPHGSCKSAGINQYVLASRLSRTMSVVAGMSGSSLEFYSVRFPSMAEATKAVAAIQSLVDCPLGAAFRSGLLEARIYGSSAEWEPVLYLSRGARAAARLAGLRIPDGNGPIAIDPYHQVSMLTMPAPEAPAAERQADAAALEADQRQRVLIVEDHEDTARTLAELIEAWGWSVAIAPTGRDARETAARFKPRIVLLDLGLPDEHGYRVAQDLRRRADRSELTFVVVTGWSQPVDQRLSSQAGIAHHLVKPVNPDALRAILDGYRSAA
jgi:CheY-like chemotaxis protein